MVDDERKAQLAKKVAEAVGGLIVRRDEVKEKSGRTLHDYILQRHVGDGRFAGRKSSASRITWTQPAAVTQARREHEKRGGAPLPQTGVAAAMKVGSTAARAQHEKLGGAPLPPLKRR